MSWQERAECRDMDPDLFFPGPGRGVADVALAACRRCLVRADCPWWRRPDPASRAQERVMTELDRLSRSVAVIRGGGAA